jgi:hypothetical protein
MDVPMPRMSTSLVGRSHKNIFLWLDNNPQEGSDSADASATTIQNIPMLPIFRSTTCLYFHDCAHGDSLRRQECYEFDVSWNHVTVPWIARMLPMLYITGLDEATTYTFYGWAKSRRNQRKSSCRQPQYRIYPMLPIFRSTCLSLP